MAREPWFVVFAPYELVVSGWWVVVSVTWQTIALVYVSYLAAVSLTRRDFARGRPALLIAAAVAWGAFVVVGQASLSPALGVVIPSLILLVGYWLSGLLFVRPDVRIEHWLQSVDHRVLVRSGLLPWFYRSPRIVQDFFELNYLLVYLAVPAGASTLVVSGHADRVGDFWSIVLFAEFACYAALPWIQTRPPRVFESAHESTARNAGIRRLNLSLVNRASIQVNTLPSGHAAGALATALAVGTIMPFAGIVFLLAALLISIATVMGRYHYVVDTVLGVLVALAAWTVL
jgi:membrane-associated phospholipid phosphatase